MTEIILRDYQHDLVGNIRKSLQSGHRKIIACSSTGSGKSVVLAELARLTLDKGGSINIVLPRKSLVAQLSDTFTAMGIQNTMLMSGNNFYSQARCKIISIDTYMARLKSGRIKFLDADMLCIDEQQLQHSKGKIELFDKYKIVVAFTATPTAKKKLPLNVLYSDIVEAISMKELIGLGYLVPLKYFAPADFHPENVKIDRDGDYIASQLDEYIDTMLKDAEGNAMLVGDIYKNWEKLASDRQTVVFCKTQLHARAVTDEFISNGVKALYIDCNTDMNDRDEMFDAIATKKAQVIVNCSIVSVGIDIPILSCAVLAVPIRKLDKYLQCVGRLTRLHPESNKIDGIVIDHCGCVARLGMADDHHEWSLDGEFTPEELTAKAKEEGELPKEITCKECGYVYKSRRDCPRCSYESIPVGEAIPHHEVELVEVKTTKPKPAEKAQFYAEMLGYCHDKGKKTSYALAIFKNRFNEWPNKKRGVQPVSPSKETLSYIRSRNIAYSKRK